MSLFRDIFFKLSEEVSVSGFQVLENFGHHLKRYAEL